MLFRIFTPSRPNGLDLQEDSLHYLTRVLRLGTGDSFEAVSGTNEVSVYKIDLVKKDTLHATKIDSFSEDNEPETKITLVQAIIKPEKMELALQKCTELGVSEFILFPADESPLKISFIKNKLQRWENIIKSAVCQSKRNHCPSIKLLYELKDIFKTHQNVYFADFAKNALPLDKITDKELTVIVGPESGFSAAERALLNHSAKPLDLGKRILRTETAGLAVCAKLLI